MTSPVLIIIPAFNEEATILNTVRLIQSFTPFDYIVINDGSIDSTFRILKENNINHISLPVNLGIGGAMQTGYQYAWRMGYDYAVQLDADGQHNPSEVTNLLEAIQDGDFDMVIGSRFLETTAYKGTLTRRIGIYYFYYLLKVIARIEVKDPTSGYRIVNRKVIQLFAQDYPVDYPEVEVLVKLARKKFRIKEVKAEMNDRQGGVSSISKSKGIYYMIKVTFFSLIRSYL
ncbi:glycosyltransferase family 2 protein [Filibacter tadaridae]|uniref:Undecaprenyl-phosphate mannosyltransferase n=1 Tax=Filibacter tadaridae TaxID=2483811 RepID=A0A3P5WQU6_9BACL|nr:glycosyltransferase family 2 protein [Filibacter tadaridae]VDC23905.1 Undecaprenyl-phosphate mannosyltransferase [Filibacter tadaridae]